MGFELIAFIILIGSFLGVAVLVCRKIPVLVELSEAALPQTNWREAVLSLAKKIKNSSPFKDFSAEVFLQKILSKVRILTLKTDNKTSSWLQKLREKSKKQEFDPDDSYWKELKKAKDRKE
jgi:hypothetical protein